MVKLLLGATAVVVLVIFVAFLEQRRLIYVPTRGGAHPREAGLAQAEAARFTADDGVGLHGWFLPAARSRRDLALLFCHGNSGNASHREPVLMRGAAIGLDVLVFDYRGYGFSDDVPPSEDGLYRDGRAALAWLQRRTGLPPERIVIDGESLGTGVAIQLATELGPRAPAALVLEAPFTRLADAGVVVYPWLPVRWLLRERYDNLAKIGSVHAPLLIVHGTRDRIVPIEQGRALLERAAEPKRMLVVKGAGHGDLWDDARARRAQLAAFLDELVPARETADAPTH